MATWDSQQYEQFLDARKRPGLDLIAHIPQINFKYIVDLGCGTGYLTTKLRERFPQSHITAIDSSAQMLEKARTQDIPIAPEDANSIFRCDKSEPGVPKGERYLPRVASADLLRAPSSKPEYRSPKSRILNDERYSSIDWQQGDIAEYALNNVDLLFSNAALHWLEHHDVLFKKLLNTLQPGGYFAIQMPNNFKAPSHQLILETIQSGPWKEKLLPLWRDTPTQEATWYYQLLNPLCSMLNIWETTYYQPLSGDNPVVEWTKGTWLRIFLNKLEQAEQAKFLKQYAELTKQAYPKQQNGITLLPFKRLFLVGQVNS